MSAPRKVVVGLSMSESLLPVFDHATALARAVGAELVLAHTTAGVPAGSQAEDLFRRQITDVFWGLRARRRAQARIDPLDYLRSEPVPDALEEVARQTEADWLLVGAGRRGPLERLLSGSVTEEVLRRASRPVWVAPRSPRPRELERIVCAVDDSEAARSACLVAAELARSTRAELSLLAVGAPQRTQSLTARLTRWLGEEGGPERLEVATTEGGFLHEAARHVQRTRAGLLVVGCAGRQGLRRLLRRNSVERLLHRVPCALLSVPAPAPARRLYRRVGDRFVAVGPGPTADLHQRSTHARRSPAGQPASRPYVGTWSETP